MLSRGCRPQTRAGPPCQDYRMFDQELILQRRLQLAQYRNIFLPIISFP
jgi:hypothetical protein